MICTLQQHSSGTLIILDQISFNLQYYGELKLLSTILYVAILTTYYVLFYTEPATISIQSSTPALQYNESTTLNCTADSGYPPTRSISFIQNGRVISTTSDKELVITVAAIDTHVFGQYKCVVNNSVTTMETSFLMKQKGGKF